MVWGVGSAGALIHFSVSIGDSSVLLSLKLTDFSLSLYIALSFQVPFLIGIGVWKWDKKHRKHLQDDQVKSYFSL